MVEDTKYYSKKIGNLAKGCESCVRGCKIVIYATGVCARNCYFCPTSDEKTKNDVTFANERKLNNSDTKIMMTEIFEEIQRQNARGAGITGGDPLSRLDRTVHIITELKKKYGKTFHIHLYTIFNTINDDVLSKLHEAGLDEIRFHPDLDNDSNWDRLNLAKKKEFNWDVGVEIPVIPGKLEETKKLIKFIEGKVDFINLNELEIADNEASKLTEMGMKTKDNLSYAVKGSEDTSIEILKFIETERIKINAHYCTAKLKDGVQLTKRILRTGKNIKKDFEKITDEGLLVRGVIELKEPNEEKLKEVLDDLEKLKLKNLFLDKRHNRLITSISNVKRISKLKKDIFCSISTEYPTYDSLSVEKEFL